jgi:predicted restriction endonuclease
MSAKSQWSREQLLVAFNIYCRLPFGKFHSGNPEIIKYAKLINRTPSALAMKLTNIASLDPAITSTGRKGLTGASIADKRMWEEMQNNWEGFVNETYATVNSLTINKFSEEDREFLKDIEEKDHTTDSYVGYNKIAETKIRVGQSFFRKAVLSAYDFKCCITGLNIPKLLVASHIMPWKDNPQNRLNPKNGLCLSVLHDKAFDLGIITITENFTIKVSKKEYLNNNDFFISTLLNYENKKIRLPEKFLPHQEFLTYHRENIFKA